MQIESGLKMGKLLVISKIPNAGRRAKWLCRCDCGIERPFKADVLKAGAQSCGCILKAKRKTMHKTHGHRSHGTASSEYNCWLSIRRRCSGPGPDSKNYFDAGVRVCDRWENSFDDFYEDMGPKPTPRHSIDRYPNQSGHYEPGNCRWATPKQQANNMRTNRILEYRGEKITLSAAAAISGLNEASIRYRLDVMGMSDQDAIDQPRERRHL